MARYPLLKELRDAGWTITHTRGGHLKATHPLADGVLILPLTPGDRRNDANSRAQARRMLRSAPRHDDERREKE